MGYNKRKRFPWLQYMGINKAEIVRWRRSGLVASCLLLAGLVLVSYQSRKVSIDSQVSSAYSFGASRRLLATDNASDVAHGPVWEQCTDELSLGLNAAYGITAAYVFLILIVFVALAVICDDFFVPSLEAISEKLKLSEDVAGATFMAAGSSAPELFTSVAGVAVQTDVGVGTIVGSAVFNILIIIAMTAALAGQVLTLDWRPLIRDAFFYGMSLACFIGFAWDGYYTHYESIILLLLYSLYIVLMVFNGRLMDWMGTWKCFCQTTVLPVDAETAEPTATNSNIHLKDKTAANGTPVAVNGSRKLSLGIGGHARRLSIISYSGDPDKHMFHHKRGSIVAALSSTTLGRRKSLAEATIQEEEKNGDVQHDETKDDKDLKNNNAPDADNEESDEEETCQICPCLPCCPAVRTAPPKKDPEGGCKASFLYVLKWILFIISFPFVMLFSWTIPDCSKPHNRKWYIVSFVMSVVWIALLSFVMVTLVSRMGCILGIDTYLMGLTLVAIGTSVPDALSSILVARDGYGDMAVSNAIGSNVFDINLGLGLPFLIRICIDAGAPFSLLSSEEWLSWYSGKLLMTPHAKFGFLLILILIITLFVFTAARFRLNKYIGISFVILYFLFITYSCVQYFYCIKILEIQC